MSKWESNEEIRIFREYLCLGSSVHPKPNYEPCVQFLREQASKMDLAMRIFYPVNEANPIVILSWIGTDPLASTILLNSHMDVVPVFPENWTHPPFGAEIDEEGRIFARGAQDMKCVGTQYLGAIRTLKAMGKTFKRTIHISFVPDEEMGGSLGMRAFVHTDDFKNLNVGFALDEGLASPNETFLVFYGERSVWRINFHISGTSGHGSLLLKNTVGEKLRYIIDKMMDMRKVQEHRLIEDTRLTIGDVTTINLTRIQGGVQSNVVPPALMVGFDVRLANDVDHDEFEAQLLRWCDEAGGEIELTYDQKRPKVKPTVIDASNIFWVAFKDAIDGIQLKVKTEIFTGGTDSRYIRELGIPAIGFSPMNHTPVLLHDHDEYLKADIYLKGIEIYTTIIGKIADL